MLPLVLPHVREHASVVRRHRSDMDLAWQAAALAQPATELLEEPLDRAATAFGLIGAGDSDVAARTLTAPSPAPRPLRRCRCRGCWRPHPRSCRRRKGHRRAATPPWTTPSTGHAHRGRQRGGCQEATPARSDSHALLVEPVTEFAEENSVLSWEPHFRQQATRQPLQSQTLFAPHNNPVKFWYTVSSFRGP